MPNSSKIKITVNTDNDNNTDNYSLIVHGAYATLANSGNQGLKNLTVSIGFNNSVYYYEKYCAYDKWKRSISIQVYTYHHH